MLIRIIMLLLIQIIGAKLILYINITFYSDLGLLTDTRPKETVVHEVSHAFGFKHKDDKPFGTAIMLCGPSFID
ncbi:hypothetical protein FS935_22230 [Metabacillus litoralis]|uniref:Peptidase M10 metallopeptidase domain-containing protein n=1 Tax=Metabacillus litoralis TaxID=152268 RepID=A0A5C6V5N9_9BACI|nr:hypothetical protein [Metabacillus litoralis]TXC79015.1 hypothetical protein FS935_22230 [Metabacillus litoralis]